MAEAFKKPSNHRNAQKSSLSCLSLSDVDGRQPSSLHSAARLRGQKTKSEFFLFNPKGGWRGGCPLLMGKNKVV